MSPQSKTTRAADLEVHYLEAGSGRLLILLHGGTATADSWGEWLPRLAERFHVFAPDTRGHGRTDNPAGKLGYDMFADDTAHFISALGLRKPVIIGYSDGGQAALEFGLRHPGKAGALVLGGTISEPTDEYIEGLHGWGFPRPGEVDFDRLAKEYGSYMDVLRTAHAHHYGPDYWRTFLAQISELWLTLPRYTERQLASISPPTLVIMGDRDHLGGPLVAHRLFRHLPRGELAIVPDSGHDAIEKPILWDLVGDFLRRHPD